MKTPLRSKLAALAVIVLFGLVRLPLESGIERDLRAAHFRDTELDLSMREQLGQGMFVASIGGFRSLIASILYLQAHADFENREWAKVEAAYGVITRLQPRSIHYWDNAHWHMAYNAFGYYQRTAATEPDSWEAWKMTNQLAPYYLERGRQFLEDGLRHNPDSYILHRAMGDLRSKKYGDDCGAADWYLRGSKLTNARSYMHRLYLYAISKCPERIDEAYAALREAYHAGSRTPTVLLEFEKKEDHFIDLELKAMSVDEIRAAALAVGDDEYLPVARLARHFETVARDDRKAAALFQQLVRLGQAPEFYQKKWGLALARIPGMEKEAHQVLGNFLAGKLRGAFPDADETYQRLGAAIGKE